MNEKLKGLIFNHLYLFFRNADTQQAFDEIMNGMIETEEELSDKLSATSRRLAKAKESLVCFY